tara:strand:- start:327 stop:896 length:570 start_codon:yes stop_codon:yes gene_type:complete
MDITNTKEILNLPVPKQINEKIINYLGTQAKWQFAPSEKPAELAPAFSKIISPDKISDSGMSIITYSRNNQKEATIDYFLNSMGDWIFYLCQERSSFTLKYLERIYWNLYSPTATPGWHVDNVASGGGTGEFASILYNLHTNDGGTQFESGVAPSKEGQAVIFPSDLKHRGVAPKKNKWRLSLNMVVKT